MVQIEPKRETDLEQIQEELELVKPTIQNEVFTVHKEKLVIDFAALARILWEYQTYDQADRSNKIDILGTIKDKTKSDDWISIDELDEKHDINKASIYRNINNLQDEGLVERVGSSKSGLFRYTGPDK